MTSDYEQYIIDSLFKTYSETSGFKIKDLKGKRRIRQLVKVRHKLMQHIRICTSLSYPEIGKLFNRTHSSVLHACSKWDKQNEQK